MIFWQILILFFVTKTCQLQDSFHEELLVREQSTGHVYTLFQFITEWDVNVFEEGLPAHYNLFPKSFGEIVSTFGIVELHLSLTQGRWNYQKWGYPVLNAPTGIELWVWFHPDLNKTSVDRNWNSLVHSLSGQFCSSLNFIDKSLTSSPKYSMKPLGLWEENLDPETHLRYAALPKESVCTENLTPWKKLLPCTDKAGLGSLLNARRLYNSAYHSLAIHLRSVMQGEAIKVELKQSISSVFDPRHSNLYNGWSLEKLFGSKLMSRCPMSTTSAVFVDLNGKDENLVPKPTEVKVYNSSNGQINIALYDLMKHDFTSTDFEIETSSNEKQKNVLPPNLVARKYTTGFGKEFGGSKCIISNTHPTKTMKIIYLDILPYFVRTYFHTLQLTVNKEKIQPDSLHYTPAYYRERPATIELIFNLPPLSTATISFDFEKVFLDWLQHPPNSEHGFYIGSSVISSILPDLTNSTGYTEICSIFSRFDDCMTKSSPHIFYRLYTDPLLIRPPLPDFSMPYNVICLTCTVIAIAFGSIFNLTTRTFTVEGEKEKKSLKEKIKTFLNKFFKQKNTEVNVDVSTSTKDPGNDDAGDNVADTT